MEAEREPGTSAHQHELAEPVRLTATRAWSNGTHAVHAAPHLTPRLLVFVRFSPDDVVIVRLNIADDEAEDLVPVRSNPQIPAQMRENLLDGFRLRNTLDERDRVALADGGFSLTLAARSSAIYRVWPPVRLDSMPCGKSIRPISGIDSHATTDRGLDATMKITNIRSPL